MNKLKLAAFIICLTMLYQYTMLVCQPNCQEAEEPRKKRTYLTGMCPVGIGELLRQIIGKSILLILKTNIMQVAGATQVCVGQSAGCEAAICALYQILEAMGTNGVILGDADNVLIVSIRQWQYTTSNTSVPCSPPRSSTFIVYMHISL